MVISNNSGVAEQPFAVALTDTVPVIAARVLLVLKNVGMFPLPDPANPMPVLELVHETVALLGVTTTDVVGIVTFSQSTISVIGVMTGVGLMVMLKLTGEPTHELRVGVIETFPLIGVEPLFVAVNGAIDPVPLAPNPIAVLVLVQSKAAPVGLLTKAGGETVPPHCVIAAGTVMVGVGFTVI